MKQRRTSLKDLAAELHVSIATVSRALHGSHEVGEEMRKKVQELAKQRNYHPNPFAQSLRKEGPHIIGVVVPNLVTHYFASVLDGIEDYAQQHGFLVFSANSHESCLREVRAIESFLTMHVDGVISCLAQDTIDYSHYEEMERLDVLLFSSRAPVFPTVSPKWFLMAMWPLMRPPSICWTRARDVWRFWEVPTI